MTGERMRVVAGVFTLDGSEAVRAEAEGPADDPVAVADRVADDLIARGAERILEGARV